MLSKALCQLKLRYKDLDDARLLLEKGKAGIMTISCLKSDILDLKSKINSLEERIKNEI